MNDQALQVAENVGQLLDMGLGAVALYLLLRMVPRIESIESRLEKNETRVEDIQTRVTHLEVIHERAVVS